jgi:hypothetical protein
MQVAPNCPPTLVTACWNPDASSGITTSAPYEDGADSVSPQWLTPLRWEVIKELDIGKDCTHHVISSFGYLPLVRSSSAT